MNLDKFETGMFGLMFGLIIGFSVTHVGMTNTRSIHDSDFLQQCTKNNTTAYVKLISTSAGTSLICINGKE